jgi:uncharacterized protein YrrD
MRKSKRFESMPVISLEEGQQIGHVKSLVIDPANKKVAALIIEQKGWFKEQRFIPYQKINSAGSDAITIEKTAHVERGTSLPDIVKLVRERIDIIGAKLVAENGSLLGHVDEYYVELATGNIAGVAFSSNLINSLLKGHAFLDIAYVRTLGKEVVIVTNEALDNIVKLDGGLQETVKSFRESTGHIWENTLQKTKGLGNNLNKSIEKVKRDIKPGGKPEDEEGSINKQLKDDGAVSKDPPEAPQPEKEEITPAIAAPPQEQEDHPGKPPKTQP